MPALSELPHEQRLRLFSAQAKEYAILTLDPDGTIVDWSIGAQNLMGWTADEVKGKSCALIFTPEDQYAGVPQAELETARCDGKASDVRWHIRKDGSRFFVDGVMCAIYAEDGTVIGFGKILHDLTGRKETSDFLARQASLLDLSFEPAFCWDLATNSILYWNKGSEDLYAFRADEAIGENPHQLLKTVFPEKVEVVRERLKRTGRWVGNLVHEKKDGTQVHVESRMMIRTDLADTPIVLEVTRDMTKQRQVEEHLRQLAASLSAANRRQGEFLTTLAHELRNPLSPVKSGLDLLRIGADKQEIVAKVREMMERQIDHLTRLVNDLLDLARINSGKIDLHKTRAQLKEIVMSGVETSMPEIQSRHHHLTIDIPDETIWLDADTNRLSQVVSNLLNNAAKYTPNGGKIDLTVRRYDSIAEIIVTDNGIGIPPDALPYIFEMFTQVGNGTEQAQGGLGIGLNLVKRLTEKHGGAVSVSSSGPNQGATFKVRLRVHERNDKGVPVTSPQDPVAPNVSPHLRVLIADDNKDAANTLAALLELSGHTVKIALDGKGALRLAEEFHPDLGLLDIGMPGMTGYEVAQAIRMLPGMKHMTLAALTGWGTKEDQEKTRQAGFDIHLTKPVEFGAISDLLAKVKPLSEVKKTE